MKKKYVKPEMMVLDVHTDNRLMAVSQSPWAESKGGEFDLDEDFDDFSDSPSAFKSNENIWHE